MVLASLEPLPSPKSQVIVAPGVEKFSKLTVKGWQPLVVSILKKASTSGGKTVISLVSVSVPQLLVAMSVIG